MLCVHFYFGVISFVSLQTFIDSSNVDNLIQTITHVHASRNNNNLKINETVKPWITWLDPFYLSTMFVGELNDTGGFKDKEKPLSKLLTFCVLEIWRQRNSSPNLNMWTIMPWKYQPNYIQLHNEKWKIVFNNNENEVLWYKFVNHASKEDALVLTIFGRCELGPNIVRMNPRESWGRFMRSLLQQDLKYQC